MSELTDQDLEAIKQIHTQWIDAELEANRSQIIDLCAREIIWLPPQAPPIVGKEAIGQYLTANCTDLKEVQSTDLMIRGSNTVAYLTSNYCAKFVDTKSSKLLEAKGSHLWVLRKNTGGSWQVAVVSWSEWETG